MHRDVIAAIERSCEQLRLASVRMPSYAGHDTMVMSGLTRSGMFFVPSLGGHSHSAREYTSDEDCVTAGNILLHTVLQLAAG
jgi:N-carbamoyl-L-amino-acid hydrolase